MFDPYVGVGTSLIAGIMHNRRVMGSEQETKYVDIACERLQAYFNGVLPYRPLGKPVYRPTGREQVAQMPKEWQSATQGRLLEKEEKYE